MIVYTRTYSCEFIILLCTSTSDHIHLYIYIYSIFIKISFYWSDYLFCLLKQNRLNFLFRDILDQFLIHSYGPILIILFFFLFFHFVFWPSLPFLLFFMSCSLYLFFLCISSFLSFLLILFIVSI